MAQRDEVVSRRAVLKAGAAAGAATLASGVPIPAFATTPGRRVAVFGGGPAGLTVAHELAERGFAVTVYEPTAWGGKARSIGVAGTGGRGTITGGSIESSNVDVATEFSKMIEAQQMYSANAKTVTTFQQISQATIQMIS